MPDSIRPEIEGWWDVDIKNWTWRRNSGIDGSAKSAPRRLQPALSDRRSGPTLKKMIDEPGKDIKVEWLLDAYIEELGFICELDHGGRRRHGDHRGVRETTAAQCPGDIDAAGPYQLDVDQE